MSINNFYKNKNIFITGHTGFKGVWLAMLLKELGANITGYSLSPTSEESLFNLTKTKDHIDSNIADIRNLDELKSTLNRSKPDIVFHLAAQPLVLDSYIDPIKTYTTNVIGTVNILEAAKELRSIKAILNITTDKCYNNKEWNWPYRETDQLGGHDPYSSSKACSELITSSYKKSFFPNIGIATARAGNVIGGGDFSDNRLIPDIVRSIKNSSDLQIRNPKAIRPWQHVLDVIYGYLLLAKKLYEAPGQFSEPFNFSPLSHKDINVETLIDIFNKEIGSKRVTIMNNHTGFHEAQTLKLDSSKSSSMLHWNPKYDITQTIKRTALWYKGYIEGQNADNLCKTELEKFMEVEFSGSNN